MSARQAVSDQRVTAFRVAMRPLLDVERVAQIGPTRSWACRFTRLVAG